MEEQKKSLFKNRAYLFLISGQIISDFGTWLNLLGVITLVAIRWNATPMEVSLVAFSLMSPMIFFGSIAGVYADRFDRKKIMILSDVFSGIVVTGLFFASDTWQIYIILFLQGTLSALFTPAKNGKIKEIVSDDNMQQAMAISAMIDSATKIAGPLLSGVIVATLGVRSVFLIDSVTYFASALLLIGVPATMHLIKDKENKEKESFISQFVGGFTFIKSKSFLLVGLISATVVFFVLQLADAQFSVLVRQLPEMQTEVLGMIMASAGAGLLVSSTILSKLKIKNQERALGIGTFVVGLGYAGAVFSINLLPMNFVLISIPAIIFMAGSAFPFVLIPFQTAAQQETPVEYSGRVFGTINSSFTLASLLGTLLGGVLVTFLGVNEVFVACGAGLGIIGIGVVLFNLYKKATKQKVQVEAEGA